MFRSCYVKFLGFYVEFLGISLTLLPMYQWGNLKNFTVLWSEVQVTSQRHHWPFWFCCHNPSCISVTIGMDGVSVALFRQDEIRQRHPQSPHIRGYSDPKHPELESLSHLESCVPSPGLEVSPYASHVKLSHRDIMFLFLTPPKGTKPSFPGTCIECICLQHCLLSNERLMQNFSVEG